MMQNIYVMQEASANLRLYKMPCFPRWLTWLLTILSLTSLVIPSMNISIFISLPRIPLIIPFSHVSAALQQQVLFWLI